MPDETFTRALGHVLRAMRIERGWSLDGLAARLARPVTGEMLGSYERARTQMPVGRLAVVADALGVPVTRITAAARPAGHACPTCGQPTPPATPERRPGPWR